MGIRLTRGTVDCPNSRKLEVWSALKVRQSFHEGSGRILSVQTTFVWDG